MSKPLWSLVMEWAATLERNANMLRERALAIRCPVRDLGGARCTADAQPEHEHRHEQEDLPC
jgi:hypothetical protein